MDLPYAVLDPSCVWDPDINRVASGILAKIAHIKNNEVGGVLYKNEAGEYCYSAPLTSRSNQNIQYKVRVPKGLSVAGMYHTHPDTIPEKGGMFSPEDVEMADALKVPSYILSQRSGDINRYAPGDKTRVNLNGKRKDGFTAEGNLIAKLADLKKASETP